MKQIKIFVFEKAIDIMRQELRWIVCINAVLTPTAIGSVNNDQAHKTSARRSLNISSAIENRDEEIEGGKMSRRRRKEERGGVVVVEGEGVVIVVEEEEEEEKETEEEDITV